MAGNATGLEGAGTVSAPSPVLSALASQLGKRPVRREPLHLWEMSSVERIHLHDGGSVILKTAVPPFTAEARVLQHAQSYGVPVPHILTARMLLDGSLAMLMKDLGPHPVEDVPLPEGARAAVAVHSCPPLAELPHLDAATLATLPDRALVTLDTLQAAGRWPESADIRTALEQLSDVADARVQGIDIPPYGMCHSEFHPTSLHAGGDQVNILDWARAFTGPGLLDLASWEDTPLPLNLDAIRTMIGSYIAAGGPPQAAADRGGLPAEVWAGGWHRVWISEWYLQQSARWIPDPARDPATARTVRRHLFEAIRCLIK